MLELKQLSDHLCYAFLGENSTLSVTVLRELSEEKKSKLVELLKKYMELFTWKILDIKGIILCFAPVRF